MLSRIRWGAAAMAVAATLVLWTPPAPQAHAQFFGMSEGQEIQIGRQVETEVASKPGFVDDPGLTKYVAGLGLRLARVSERPTLPWTYHIVRDKSVNAFAAPGGFLFVDQGLLRFVKSEDELGFVLGHETTHVAHRHAVDLAQRDMELQFGAVLLTQFVFGGSLAAYQISQLARGLIDAKYSRDKEFEADRYGVIYARKAGFNPVASLVFFERLAALDKSQPGLTNAFESHPDTPDRIKALREQLHALGYQVAAPADAPPPPAWGTPTGPARATAAPSAAPARPVSSDR
jgi:predicted Zn-dependent protease